MYIIFDIGGTNTRVASSHDRETFGEPIKFKTPLAYQEGIVAIHPAIRELLGDESVEGIAGGIRGALNAHKTGIISEVILIAWINHEIATGIAAPFGAPAYLKNDSAVVDFGEVLRGRPRLPDRRVPHGELWRRRCSLRRRTVGYGSGQF